MLHTNMLVEVTVAYFVTIVTYASKIIMALAPEGNILKVYIFIASAVAK
jgi:hypothetical protein